jgi:hypothetical protein
VIAPQPVTHCPGQRVHVTLADVSDPDACGVCFGSCAINRS